MASLKILFLILLSSCASQTPVAETPQRIEPGPPSSRKPVTLIDQYMELLKNYPADEVKEKCDRLNLRSARATRRNARALMKSNPQFVEPNYNGHYMMLELPFDRGSNWYLMDCKSGKYLSTFPETANLIFDKNSRVIVTQTFGQKDTLDTYKVGSEGVPSLYEWSGKSWTKIPNPVHP